MAEPADTIPPSDARPLFGPKILLEGPTGTGKTFALGGFVDWCAQQSPPIEVFVLFAESSLEVLKGYWLDDGKEIPENLHWHQALTTPLGIKDLMTAADNVGKMNYEAITKMYDGNRHKNNAFHKILSACADFPDDRTGKKFGPVDGFGIDKAFVIDGFSEVANACMKMVIGNKPTAAPPDYGVAQNNLMNFVRLCTQGLTCTFVMSAHISREKDELTGATKIMTQAIGTAISPQIPPLFSDVVLTVREGDKFYWDTIAYGVDTKTRSLGYRSKIEPKFGQIMEVWKKRGGR